MLQLHWISITTIALLCSGVIYLLSTQKCVFDWRFFFTLATPVLAFILFLPLTQNLQHAVGSISVKLVLIALGLHYAFVSLRPTLAETKTALSIFSLGSVAIVVWGLLQLAIKGFVHPIGFAGADFTFAYRIALERYTGLHPTYYCAIVYFASFINLYQLVQQPFDKRSYVWLRIGIALLCAIAGLMAASRATMFAYLCISFILVAIHIKQYRHRWWYAAGALLVITTLLFIPPIKNRLLEMNAQNMHAPSGNNDNGTNVRAGIFDCNASLIKENWLIGLGPGDVQQALNDCLGKFDTLVYEIHNYNTHNEYVNYWLTCGLLGLLSFIWMLGYSFYFAIRARNTLHIYFLLFMSICFFTENYLDRQAGVTFFALMQTLFMVSRSSEKEIS